MLVQRTIDELARGTLLPSFDGAERVPGEAVALAVPTVGLTLVG